MPYNTNAEVPTNVKKLPPKKQRQWRHVWNSSYSRHGDESRAFAEAWSTVNKRLDSTISKEEADYENKPRGSNRCGVCSMFISPNSCSLVEGSISTQGYCKYFTRSAMKTKAAASANDFSFFLPISKVDKQKRQVSGYASTPALDLDGEIVTLDAVKAALPGYWEWRNIREMHKPNAVGVAQEANVDEVGLFLSAKIVDNEAWDKVVEGVYKGFSIGGRKLNKSGNKITEIDLVEISIVDRPANPECKFTVQKSATKDAEAYLVKQKPFRDPRNKAVAQMAKAVATLSKAGPPAAHDGFSLPAKTEKSLLCKKHGIANCSKCAMKAAKKLAKQEAKKTARVQKRADKRKAKKLAKQQRFDNLKKAIDSEFVLTASPEPSFLTLTGDGSVAAAEGALKSGHELQDGRAPGNGGRTSSKKFRKMAKSMGTAGTLSYCFDSIRSAQRSLMYEAKREGGDMKDKGLAKKLGNIAQMLAAVIGQKAEHEGAEALDFSDADDQGMSTFLGDLEMSAKAANNGGRNMTLDEVLGELQKRFGKTTKAQAASMARDNMDKTRKARKTAAALIKDVHAMHKAAYLAKVAMAKAGKKPKADDDDDDFDHEGAMGKLQKAFQQIDAMKTFVKAARINLKKATARAGQRGQEVTDADAEGGYKVPPGLTDMSVGDMVTAGPGKQNQSGSMPPLHSMIEQFPGKMVKGQRVYTPAEVQLIMRTVAAESKAEALEKMPAGPVHGRKPALFDTTKLAGGGADNTNAALFKGVQVEHIGSGDEELHKKAVGRVIGNMVIGGHGKSIMDPNFHGTAGGGKI